MDKFKKCIDEGGYIWKQPYLELLDNECARYTIRKYQWDKLWHIKWWHGNRGYELGKTKTLKEAKEICVKHLWKMYESIKAELSLK